MADVKPIPAKDAKKLTDESINAVINKLIQAINNEINKESRKGNNKATYQNGEYSTNAYLKAVDEFKRAGYYTNLLPGNKLELEWSK